MNIYKRRILESKNEDNSIKKNIYLIKHKKKRIIEMESSSYEDIISQNFDSAKENKRKYMQRLTKMPDKSIIKKINLFQKNLNS